jgi:hypothetical protein
LARWIKGILLGFATFGIIFCICAIYFGVIPLFGRDIFYDDKAYVFTPWMFFLLITATPCYIFLVMGWKIAVNIENDRSFSVENATYLKKMAYLALGDTIFFAVGNIVFLFLNLSHPAMLLGSLVIDFLGVSVSVGYAALSHLVQKATEIQTENELTI